MSVNNPAAANGLTMDLRSLDRLKGTSGTNPRAAGGVGKLGVARIRVGGGARGQGKGCEPCDDRPGFH